MKLSEAIAIAYETGAYSQTDLTRWMNKAKALENIEELYEEAQLLETRDTDCEDSYARAWLKSHSRQIVENGQRITVIERLVEAIRAALTPK